VKSENFTGFLLWNQPLYRDYLMVSMVFGIVGAGLAREWGVSGGFAFKKIAGKAGSHSTSDINRGL
jgi:hypothetical protein